MNSPGLGRGPLPRVPRALWRFARASGLLVGAATTLSVGCGGRTPSAPTYVSTPPPAPAPTPVPSPKVAIVSVDGLRGDALAQAAVPNILGLARRGMYTWKAQTVYPSMTLPAHTSMLTGFLPTAHGILWDDYNALKGNCSVPTIFALAKAAGLRTVLVAGKDKFRHLNVDGTIDSFVLTTRGDVDVDVSDVGLVDRRAVQTVLERLPGDVPHAVSPATYALVRAWGNFVDASAAPPATPAPVPTVAQRMATLGIERQV